MLNMCINAMEHRESCQLSLRTHTAVIGLIDSQALRLSPGDYVLANITDTVVIWIKRTGTDIRPALLHKGMGGTGLGLPPVYGFVKQN